MNVQVDQEILTQPALGRDPALGEQVPEVRLGLSTASGRGDQIRQDAAVVNLFIFRKSFCTCLARMSVSMLTRSPGRIVPSVVTARVWGMSMTEKASGPTSTSVRLTPSTAIEPLGTSRGRPGRVDREGEELPLSLPPALAEDGRRVDVPLDEMAAQAVADLERPLEVDAVAGLLVAQVGAGQGLGPGLDLELSRRRPATTVRQQPLTATLSPSSSGSARGTARPGDRRAGARRSPRRPARRRPALRPIP